jgi:hypothetical protein
LAATRAQDLENLAQINQLVIEDMLDGVIVLDGEGCIRQANRHAVRVLDLADRPHEGSGELLGRVVPELMDALEHWRKNPHSRFAPLTLGRAQAQCQPRFIAVGDRRVMGAVLVLQDLSAVLQQAQQLKLAASGGSPPTLRMKYVIRCQPSAMPRRFCTRTVRVTKRKLACCRLSMTIRSGLTVWWGMFWRSTDATGISQNRLTWRLTCPFLWKNSASQKASRRRFLNWM